MIHLPLVTFGVERWDALVGSRIAIGFMADCVPPGLADPSTRR
jgi:hypothetical protein